MTITEFTAHLLAKHPQAEVRRTERGLAINFTPDGKIYQFHGTYEAIAEQMKLIEVWYVECETGVVAKRHSEVEAESTRWTYQDAATGQATRWGGTPLTYKIRRLF